jgi:hypothetical protein
MLIIGSTAIKHWYPDFKREPKDVDYAVNDKIGYKSQHDIEYLENPILYKEEYKDYWKLDGGNYYLSPVGLLTLKMSHLFWDINWPKHMFDTQFLLDKVGVYDEELFYDLLEFWKEYHPKVRRSNLVMSKEDFFTNAINYNEHEHDHLHTLINPVPMYTRLLKDGKDVELDEDKFHLLSFEEKLEVVREEVYIMAYERFKNMHHIPAYKKMLDKFIMLHAPTYMALFAIENYKMLLKPKFNYIKQIEDGLRKTK